MDCFRIICHNKRKRNIPDGNVCRLHSNNHPENSNKKFNRFSRIFKRTTWIFTYFWINYLDFSMAFVTWRSQKLLETEFTIQIAFFFNETDILKWSSATAIHANKVIWTPDATQCGNKWSSLEIINIWLDIFFQIDFNRIYIENYSISRAINLDWNTIRHELKEMYNI